MKKHIWISGLKLNQIEERNEVFRGLNWVGSIPPSYSIHVFTDEKDTSGIISCSDAFGGGVAWARYDGKNPLVGKEYQDFDSDERDFLIRKYPAFLEAVDSL